jgi:nucleotide-binding universal stress UspA family protein
MFHNAVVGVDDGTRAQDAIALARLLLAPDGKLALAHVHGGDPRMRTLSPEYGVAERAESAELLERVRCEAGIEAELLSVGSLSVGRGLHKILAHHGADLLVLGSHRHSMFGRITLSDHLGEALNGATCPVAIAPGGYADRATGLSSVGVGYDGSPESEHALELGRRLASATGAKLSAVEVVGSVYDDRRSRANVERAIGRAEERLAALGGVEPHAAFGDNAGELALYGASVDPLIVGSGGYGPVGTLVHGSTSRRLAHISRGALLVLTRSARGDDKADEVATH